MDEIINNMPSLPTPKEIALEKLRPYIIDLGKKYPGTYYMLEDNNGNGIGAFADVNAMTGFQKNGKTQAFTIFGAAVLGSGKERTKEYLNGWHFPERTRQMLGHDPNILYVDTEQGQLDSVMMARRVSWLCEWDTNVSNERFTVLWLRTVNDEAEMKAHEIRLSLIKLAIDTFSPDIMFIDGLRDLIGNFNDNEAAAALVNEMMKIAHERNICSWCALHLNPRPNQNDDSKMRGHLGTELANKVYCTFGCKKNKQGGKITFTLSNLDARGRDVDDIVFEVTDDAGKLGIPKIISKDTAEDILFDDVINALRDMLPRNKSLIWTEIQKELIKRFRMEKKKANDIIKAALSYKILNHINCAGLDKYEFNPDFGDDNALPY